MSQRTFDGRARCPVNTATAAVIAAFAIAAGCFGSAAAQVRDAPEVPSGPDAQTSSATAPVLPSVRVQSERSIAEKHHLPNTTESIDAARIADTVNAMTVEDTLKYLPSILVRKRFSGDTQAPLATRTTGINASARSLLYADGVLLSTLINNNNANGSPQWFMLTPDEFERVDVLYGPFAAGYPGNAYGAVVEIATRMPTRFEGSARIGLATARFRQYAIDVHTGSRQGSVALGNRNGDWSWRLSASHLETDSQPLTYLSINESSTPAPAGAPVIGGAFADRNRSGAAIALLGAGNFTHTVQDNARLKLVYDSDAQWSAAYSLGYWQNRANAASTSYLTSAGGVPYYGGSGSVNLNGKSASAASIASLFSSNRVEQEHWMQSLALRSRGGSAAAWEGELIFSQVEYARDLTRTSTAAYPAGKSGGAGRITDAGGTGWQTADAKATWRPDFAPLHRLSFGAHVDRFKLVSPTTTTADWRQGSGGALFTDARGTTRTEALWLQDLWQLAPTVSATLGVRYERWRAFDGFNYALAANGAGFPVNQPGVDSAGASPKASLLWQIDSASSLTASLGRALRFPTVGELYQNVQTGTTFTQADPFLRPERVAAGELALERSTGAGRLRLSLFEERVSDALIGQNASLPGIAVPVTFVQNIQRTRQRGIELVGERRNVVMPGLDISASVTHVDARILANDNYVPTIPGATSIGKRTPYVPAWRAPAVATYKPDQRWTYTLAGRFSTRLYATVDNTDINPVTYQGFEGFFVADARVRAQIDRNWSAAFGVDNLNDRRYFLFHPFPGRTFMAELKYAY